MLVLPGVVLLDLAAPCHLFGHVGAPRYALTLVGATAGQEPAAPGTGGLLLAGLAGLDALQDADTVVVPGYEDATRAAPPEHVLAALRAAATRGARVMSVCTGAFALAHAGLLDGRRATTHWHETDALATAFPAVRVEPGALFVDEGQVLTSAGVAAGLDLCLHVVRRDHGVAVATAAARRTVIAPHRDGGQAQFVERPLPDPAAGAVDLAPTRAWALERLDAPLEVRDLARHAGVSPRTLARRFREETGATPARWVRAQRIARARELLEHDARPVEEVARACGFGDAGTLRRHFAHAVGTTPTAYRRTFRGTPARA